MNAKILIILIIAVVLVGGGGGFFIWRNVYQSVQPEPSAKQEPASENEQGTGEITPEGTSTEGAVSAEGTNESAEGNGALVEEEPTDKSECPFECCVDNNYLEKDCPNSKQVCKNNKCQWTTPVDVLSDKLINSWGADCKNQGSAQTVAECILSWQEKNIFWCYINPEAQSYFDYFSPGYPDCVVDMQFQQMLFGSFPVSKVMEMKIRDGKIFGACYTYATTYCALARWHGLTCRVMEAKTILSFYSASSGDYAPDYCGSAPKDFLDKLGYSCSEWRKKDWIVDADHYWAEVLINGKWQIMEKPLWAYKRDTVKYIISAGRSYSNTGW